MPLISLLLVSLVAGSGVRLAPHDYSAETDTVRVLVIGTFHMGAIGDALNPTVDDVLEPHRQTEIQQVVERLSDFRPTKVAIEALSSAPIVQEQFGRYLDGDLRLEKDERHQVAFRVAGDVGLSSIHGIDYDQPLDVGTLVGWAQRHGQVALAVELVTRYQQVTAEWSSGINEESTISEIYRLFNSHEIDTRVHDTFMSALLIGSNDEPVGAQLLASWYERNFRIAGNIVQLAEPGDRILVLIGANHRKLLIEILRQVPGFEVVSARDYL